MPNTVLITGCSSGIGEATARAFLADGWDVYATAPDPADLESLRVAGAKTERLDVTADGDARRAVEWVVAEAGAVDCVVNNAGYGQLGPAEDVPIERVREQYEVNVFGPHKVVRAAVPYMRRRGGGRVINVGSLNVHAPFAGSSVYSGSKAALTAWSQSLRQELRGKDVDVVLVEPGPTATPYWRRMLTELTALPRTPAYDGLYEVLARLRGIEDGGRGVVDPDSVAETVVDAANSKRPKPRYSVGWTAHGARLLAAVVPEAWRTRLLSAGMRALASGPGRRLLSWVGGGDESIPESTDRPPRTPPVGATGDDSGPDEGEGGRRRIVTRRL